RLELFIAGLGHRSPVAHLFSPPEQKRKTSAGMSGSHFAVAAKACKGEGCSNGLWQSVVFPVGVPMVAVSQAAERGHAIHALDSPTSARLLKPPTNHVLAGPFGLTTADRA